jgi:RND family efflux transporter MFP subunit
MKILPILFALLLLIACSGSSDETGVEITDMGNTDPNELAEVAVSVLKYSDFGREIVSNGRLVAVQKAELKFRSGETISKIYFKNGDRVSKGQLIAVLDNFVLRNKLEQSREQFEKARLDLMDMLIGQGYSLSDSANIPRNILSAARTKSGFDRALNELDLAKYNYAHSELRAPFGGVLADMKFQENNIASVSEKFCTLIDNSHFEAEFPVLENEIAFLRKGQGVRIIPYAIDNFEVRAVISQINPLVDKNGMVSVKAICQNTGNQLTEGMNVKVLVEDKIPRQLVIPKEALVLRSGKQVVFTFRDGLAKWNYVKTGDENSTSFAILEGLKEGDTLIVGGNLNLAHDSKVKVLNEEMKGMNGMKK